MLAAMNGRQIRAARERMGWTQADLAAAVGVGMRTVGNWERGDTVPKNRMAKLQHLFGLPAGDDDTRPDPLRGYSELALLSELSRRAIERERVTEVPSS